MLEVHFCGPIYHHGPIYLHGPFTCMGPFRLTMWPFYTCIGPFTLVRNPSSGRGFGVVCRGSVQMLVDTCQLSGWWSVVVYIHRERSWQGLICVCLWDMKLDLTGNDLTDQVWEVSSKPDCQMVGSVTLLRLTTETRCEKEAQNQTVRW